jgi:HEAT repeat protein
MMVLALAGALGGCGRSSATLAGGKPLAHWVTALGDPDPRLRKTAAFKLGNAGPADPSVLPALLLALHDPEATVRREVILALVKFGPGAQEAIPILAGFEQSDQDPQVREYAAKGLQVLRNHE